MTVKTTKLRDAITFALVSGATVLAGSGVAFAQDATTEQQATTLDRIEVTGSRIRSAELETAQPIITISREQIQQQGFSSVADVLQNMTSAGSPAISRSEVLASGENVGGYYIDIRNLGASRTLVLLNGKRLGVNTTGLQDLGQIPLAVVERIDVLKDGASSIYGSDAIAGVVNVITRRNFEGAEANAYIGQFSDGDGFKQSYDFTMGSSFDRGSVTFSAEYAKEDPVWAKDRDFSAFGNSGPAFPGSGWSAVSQNGVWLGNVNDAGDFTDPSCSSGLCTLNAGGDPRNPADYHNLTTAERANSNQQMMLQTGMERRSIFVSGNYDITDDVRFRADLNYNQRTTDQQVAGYPGQYGFAMMSADSYFNPNPTAGDAYWYRRFWEVPRTTSSELDTFRTNLALEGALQFGEKFWDWDVGVMTNRNSILKIGHGDASVPALEQALGASYLNTATGRVECGTAANPINYGTNIGSGECIPFNPFVPFGVAGQGSLGNPDLQTFLFPTYHDSGRTETTDYTANLSGSLFSLPAGDVGLAVGVEHRREKGRFVPDAFNQAGISTGLPATTTQGQYDVSEAYVELEVPLLADVPFAQELTLNVASRYSDYSNFGDTTNNKFQLRWRPIDSLLVRATYADGFRAPSIDNLYGGVGGSFEFYTDVCAVGQPGYGSAACVAAGVPVNYVQLGQGGIPCTTLPCQTGFQFITGSNPNLTPEIATSKTAGLVWSPQFVEGLDISLDWYNVRLENVIASDTVDSILRDCYVSGIASRCDGITRNAAGAITNMFFGLTNLGELETEGYDLGVKYRLPEMSFGQFGVNWQSSYVSKYDQLADLDPATLVEGYVGTPGVFRLRSNLGLTWEMGDVTLAYMGRYFSGMKESCASAPRPCDDPTNRDVYGAVARQNRTGSNTFHDLQASIELPWNGTVALGANNITGHQGPIMYTNPNSQYPYYGGFDIGRFVYLKYQQRF
ncbi:TonB-dependent receptor [Luteimonas sp. MC1782]|uniref:TonB-dependent receptor plug domain-containing protein n=1 Tax=Luteimonas sp. MC1782 TaxID=2760305 RepID=UPI001602B6C7|nr:TonB-dependent receptor [Luteimonas sp. MC1782]MBB1472780.1 TonB-dependent receptor [Luteimonas sp. MC1782]